MNKNMSILHRYANIVKRTSPLFLFTFLLLLCACSESDNAIEEFPNWKASNETYWNDLYQTTQQKISAGDNSWKIIPKYSYTSLEGLGPTDYIIVHVKNEGEGVVSPIFSDTVRVHYRGHLLPSTSYSAGYQFDTSYSGDLNVNTATPSKFAVGAVITGWTTALQKMHTGDRWDVYIPYQLGYGSTKSNAIPAYSTLVFDMMLVQFWHAGETVNGHK